MKKVGLDMVREYEKDGFLVVRGLLQDRELEPVRAVIASQVDREARKMKNSGAIADLLDDAPFGRRLYEVYKGTKRDTRNWNQKVFGRELYDFGTYPTKRAAAIKAAQSRRAPSAL